MTDNWTTPEMWQRIKVALKMPDSDLYSLRERLEQFLIIEGFAEVRRGDAMVMADALIKAGWIKDPGVQSDHGQR